MTGHEWPVTNISIFLFHVFSGLNNKHNYKDETKNIIDQPKIGLDSPPRTMTLIDLDDLQRLQEINIAFATAAAVLGLLFLLAATAHHKKKRAELCELDAWISVRKELSKMQVRLARVQRFRSFSTLGANWVSASESELGSRFEQCFRFPEQHGLSPNSSTCGRLSPSNPAQTPALKQPFTVLNFFCCVLAAFSSSAHATLIAHKLHLPGGLAHARAASSLRACHATAQVRRRLLQAAPSADGQRRLLSGRSFCPGSHPVVVAASLSA